MFPSASQSGEYRCKVLQIKHDGTLISTLISKAVTVQVCPIPVKIEKQPQALIEVKPDDSCTISCEANGYPKPHYQWFHENTKLEGETSNTLHVCKLLSFCFYGRNNATLLKLFVILDTKIQFKI